jgi:hypothetical protein
MTELTMSEALKDPLIRLMLRADKIGLGEFAELLESAARRCNRQRSPARREETERSSVGA